MIYFVRNKSTAVQRHEVACHRSLHCECGLVNEPMITLEEGEIIMVFEEFSYAELARHDDRELFEDTWSFLVLLRGNVCSICFSRSHLSLEEIECYLPTIALSSELSL